ncbi:hypothetical protein Tco_0715786 [Tanacetum coccineum]
MLEVKLNFQCFKTVTEAMEICILENQLKKIKDDNREIVYAYVYTPRQRRQRWCTCSDDAQVDMDASELCTFTEQFPEPESKIHEPKIMADPNDDISVIKKIPAQPKADVSEPDVNGHVEPEVDEAINADSHEDPSIFWGPSADHCTSEMETVSSFVSAILTQSWFTSS